MLGTGGIILLVIQTVKTKNVTHRLNKVFQYWSLSQVLLRGLGLGLGLLLAERYPSKMLLFFFHH